MAEHCLKHVKTSSFVYLSFSNESGTYVINKQSVAKEIWLSSPISGPYHFALQGKQWKSRTGAELYQVLSYELQIEIKG